MMDRPPWASPFIRETTWKQEALSRPLQGKGHRETPVVPNQTPRSECPGWVCAGRRGDSGGIPSCRQGGQGSCLHGSCLPGGLIEEHDRRVVHQLQRDGQALSLAAREAAGPRVGARQQAQGRQDLLDLGDSGARVASGTTCPLAAYRAHVEPPAASPSPLARLPFAKAADTRQV